MVSRGYEGQELINEFKQMKKNVPVAMDKLINEAEKDNLGVMSKEEFERQIGL